MPYKQQAIALLNRKVNLFPASGFPVFIDNLIVFHRLSKFSVNY